MDYELIKQELIEWMIQFVEKPNPKLGNWAPCPYARAARVNNKMLVLVSEITELKDAVLNSLTEFDKYDVIVICFDHTLLTAIDCQTLANSLNEMIMPNNFVLLEDHPDSIETVADVTMNFGKSGLFIISPLSDLNRASKNLLKSGYYERWSLENLNDVVNWRTM